MPFGQYTLPCRQSASYRRSAAGMRTFCALHDKVEDCIGSAKTKERQPQGLSLLFWWTIKVVAPQGQYTLALRLVSQLPDLRARCANLGPTGYTPCEPRGHFVSDIAMRCAHGAICARLACASTDSLTLDYVASGSTGRAVSSSRLNGATKQKETTTRVVSFVLVELA